MRLLAATLAERVTGTHVHRQAASKIGQRKIYSPVPTVGRPQQREQTLVLIDGQQLPIAKRPSLGRKDETHDSDLRQKWFSHSSVLLAVSAAVKSTVES